MKKTLFFLVFALLLNTGNLFAQLRSTGREAAKGEFNFTELARYYSLHPDRPRRREIDNDEDNDHRPNHPACTDTSLIKTMRTSAARGTSWSALLPVSPAPTDSFDAVNDPGTAIPPDTHGAVDSNYCMTTVNTNVKIQTRGGGAVSQVSLNAFWSSVVSSGTFDPRVHYDPYTNRWFVVTVSGAQTAASSILIAVSKTSNPTGAWWTYRVTADGTGVNWLDFPNVGFNQKWLVITGNLFANTGSAYNGAKTYVFNKANLMSGVGAAYTSFLRTTSFTLCPALTYDPTLGSMFMIESWDGTAIAGGQMELWKITGAVGSETLTSVSFPASAGIRWQNGSNAISGTSGADFAPQLGTTNKIQTNDDRVDQVTYINGHLWFAHTIWLPYSGTVNATRSSIQWWEIDTAGTPVQIGMIDDATNANFYAFPTLAVNSSNDALIGFSRFSSALHPSASYALRMHTDPLNQIRPDYIYRHGQNTYFKNFGGPKDRWGDYSACAIDPVNMTDFYTIQEASAAAVNTWDTWWAHVKLCSPPAAITGTFSVCVGGTTTLIDDTLGGTWSSTNTAVATIGSGTGVLTGVAAGTSIISYIIPYGCYATKVVTVNPSPAAIVGPASLCTGGTVTYTDVTGTGTWSSSNTTVATIGATTGSLNGLTAGTTTVSYILPSGCSTTMVVSVNSAPGPIVGSLSLCTGSTTTLSDATPGGTWTSVITGVASINATTGLVTGLAAGTTTISYSLGGTCVSTAIFTVFAGPSAITGTTGICTGSNTTLSSLPGGGTWSSSNTTVATIGATTGLATGLSAGTSIISYLLGSGCSVGTVITVNSAPGPITGTTTLCTGNTSTLGNATAGGVWTSGTGAVATIGASSGVVSGLSAGTSTIVYTLAGGCNTSTVVTVNSSPAPITGGTVMCVGFNSTLSDATGGGTWSSSNSAIASVGVGTGLVSGNSAGTATISYIVTGGCYAVSVVTINALPGAIGGGTSICTGASTTLTNSVAGGAWTSSNTTIFTVGGATGVSSGIAAGTATATYTLGVGCYSTTTITVNAGPAPITGTLAICLSGTSFMNDATPGGTWSSSNATVATISAATGLVTGMSMGTSTISYIMPSGCFSTSVVSIISSTASPILGAANACVGQTTTYTNASIGGAWSSSNPAVATVTGSTGIVTGITTGVVTISYNVTTSCGPALSTKTISVEALPSVSSISGLFNLCLGGSTTLTDVTPLGTWSSSTPAIASITSTGLATGVSVGTSIISYTVTNSFGCYNSATAVMSVTNSFTSSITPSGPTTFCTGGSVLLSASTGAGYTYQWQLGGVNIAGATTPSLLVTTATGNYNVVISNGSGCTSVSNYIFVTVNASHIVTPMVAISATPGNVLCVVSSMVTFNATPTFGGTAPTYLWYKNGFPVGVGSSYAYAPANGDVIKCTMTSNDVCAFPDTATNSMVMTISPLVTPSVSISTNPGGIVCVGNDIAFTAVPVFGGTSPIYLWTLNGVNVATGPIYVLYTPATSDVVKVFMTSNYPCVTTNSAVSSPVVVTVKPVVTNTISISVSQSSILSGQTDTFTATAPFAGTSPIYQWYIDGAIVAGATSRIFTTAALTNGQTVNCQVTSSDPCAEPATVISSGITVNVGPNKVGNINPTGIFKLVPNPNNGEFTITGTLADPANTSATIKIVNVLGQVIYTGTTQALKGEINEHLKLGDNISRGLYLVSITSGEEHTVFQVSIIK